jgi:hypothetical protein
MGAVDERHRRLHPRRFHSRRDHLGGKRIVYEIISRTRFQQFRETRLSGAQTLNSFNPNRPGISKIPKNIVGLVHNPPPAIQGKRPHRKRKLRFEVQFGYQRYCDRGAQPIVKTGPYGVGFAAARSSIGGYVNSDDVLYIFRNCGQALEVCLRYGGKVASRSRRCASPEWIMRNLIAVSRSLDKMCEE